MDRANSWINAHPNLALLCLGALSALGFQPLNLWPVAMLALAGFVWLTAQASSVKNAFCRGWLFAWAHFTVTNNWIASAFTYQSEMPAALGYVAVPGLAAYLALYPALAAAVSWAVKAWLANAPTETAGANSPVMRLLVFTAALAGAWIATEWLRSWVFTGYAWGPLSLMLVGDYDRAGIARLLPYFGSYALSGWVIAAAGLIAICLISRRWIMLLGTAALLVAAMVWPAGERPEGTLAVTLVQPDIRQEVLDDPSNFEEQFMRLARLSRGEVQGREEAQNESRLVLWPESGLPDYLRDGYPQRYYTQMTAGGDPQFARLRIGQAIGENSLLLTGAIDLEIGERDGRPAAIGAYNTITPIAADGTLGARYAKAHLVPGGEYLPMRDLLEPLGLSRLVAGTLDFIPGPGPQTQELGVWGKAGMQICYEIVFSGQVVDPALRPDYIFNPSNDGWFGSWGPPQHLAQARMRAAEEGLPVLRSTTTGVSAVIDADGIVRASIGMQREGRIDMAVPPAKAPTLFARFGERLTFFWTVLFWAFSLVASRVSKR
jgi:apolipoprotein N-acyltransferase